MKEGPISVTPLPPFTFFRLPTNCYLFTLKYGILSGDSIINRMGELSISLTPTFCVDHSPSVS